jgi:hypothetical protein
VPVLLWDQNADCAGADGLGALCSLPRKLRVRACSCCEGFSRPENDKEFKAELTRLAGDDAELLTARDTEVILRQLLTASPGVQDFVKHITKKYLQR